MIIQMKSFIIMIQMGTVLDRFKQGLCWIYIVFKVLKLVIFPGTALNELSFPRGTDVSTKIVVNIQDVVIIAHGSVWRIVYCQLQRRRHYPS